MSCLNSSPIAMRPAGSDDHSVQSLYSDAIHDEKKSHHRWRHILFSIKGTVQQQSLSPCLRYSDRYVFFYCHHFIHVEFTHLSRY